jgi:hypothetical protein
MADFIGKQDAGPKCTGCGKQPIRFSHNMHVTPGGAVISFVWCSDCGYMFATQCMGQKPAIISPPGMGVIKPS